MADDRTQFYIDILAKMTGADTSIAAVQTLGDKMLAGKATVAEFERTIESMSGALEESGAAMKAANEALAAGETKYGQLEVAADRAAKMVEKLAASGKSGDAFAKRQAEAAQKAEEAAQALTKEAAAVDALKTKAGAAAAQQDALTKGLKNVKGAAEQAAKAEGATKGSGKVNEIAEALGKLGGPAGVAGQKIFGLATGFQKLGSSIGSLGPYVAAAVAIIAIGTAALFATAGITKWAVGLADTNRTQGLLLDGIARSSKGGGELAETIDRLGGIVPSTSEELTAMAKTLADSGLRGKELSKQLEATAIKAAKLKFGPDFAAQMLALDVQSKRFGANISNIFGGLKIDPLLEGIQTLGALFDSSTASGKALKFLFEALFQPVVDGATKAIPSVERLFLQAEILALKAYIALKPYSEQIALVGQLFLGGAAVISGVFVAALGLLAGAVVVATAAVGALVFGLYKLVTAPGEVWAAIQDAFGGAATFLTDIGAQMVAGLVNGITGAASAVVDALSGVVTGGIDAAKKALGIASPSKVFEDIGRLTSAGFAGGVDAGAGEAQDSVESLTAPPAAGGAGGGSRFGDITINVTVEGGGGGDGDGLAAKIAAAVRDVFESDALMLGGGEAVA
jgi:hypothetical protein